MDQQRRPTSDTPLFDSLRDAYNDAYDAAVDTDLKAGTLDWSKRYVGAFPYPINTFPPPSTESWAAKRKPRPAEPNLYYTYD